MKTKPVNKGGRPTKLTEKSSKQLAYRVPPTLAESINKKIKALIKRETKPLRIL